MSESNKEEFFENYETNAKLNYYDSFEAKDLNIKDEILKGIYAYGFEKPSQIQRVAIKPIIDGNDIVVQSHSGTGKTATFIIGILQKLDITSNKTQFIIISNTRELAVQTNKVFNSLSSYFKVSSNLCIGGDMQYKYNTNNVNDQVIIGTPGRISDLVNKNIIDLSNLKMIVIDEADDVLSNSFRKQIKKIFNVLPDSSQVVLISATIPEEMSSLFNSIFKPNYLTILVKDEEITLDGIKQFYINLDEQFKIDALMDLYKFISIGQAIVYCNKKFKADDLQNILEENNFSVSILHGDMLQKEREEIMTKFRNGQTRILITTDILARGIDIQQVSLVINYDMPKYPQTYIHRIGRSGRFGRKGTAINFVTKKERNILISIKKMYNTEINELPADVSNLI